MKNLFFEPFKLKVQNEVSHYTNNTATLVYLLRYAHVKLKYECTSKQCSMIPYEWAGKAHVFRREDCRGLRGITPQIVKTCEQSKHWF